MNDLHRPGNELLDHIFSTMRENERFLRQKASRTEREVMNCANDAMVNRFIVTEPETSVKICMPWFIRHILMPGSYTIYVSLLVGDLPACFVRLRLMLESLAKCYVADIKYSGIAFFAWKGVKSAVGF